MTARASGKIRSLLIKAGLVTADDWKGAASDPRGPLTALLEGSLDEGALLSTLGQAAGVPPVDLERVLVDKAALDVLPVETLREFGILPLSQNGNVLTIAIADPFDVLLFDDLRHRTSCQIQPVVTHPGAIERAFKRLFDSSDVAVDDLLDEMSNGDTTVKVEQETEDIETAAQGESAPAVKLANVILLKALQEKASDIHIEPGEHAIRVRYRVDGRLHEVMRPPKGLLPALSSRFKIVAQLDIAERYRPQDGKFQIRYEGRRIDFRLSILPVVGGEKIVVRILDTGSLALNIDTLGYEAKALHDIHHVIAQPYGMMLVTGPTGSGKSTTLYSCVREVAKPEVNVVTVEDPVEYRMDGINQVPVNPKRGLTFAGALRSILRQDPDIVLVGEIRDTETAEIAIKAALTGHLVLSTLHTNDAASTITRLIDMGIDAFMVSSSLLCVGAQRLARKLCEGCRQPIDVPEEELLSVGFTEEQLGRLERLYEPGPGCPRCKDGYSGRFAILETLPVDAELKRMVVAGRSSLELKAEAVRQGMQTLRQVGIENAMRGRTSLAEVLRVTLADDK